MKIGVYLETAYRKEGEALFCEDIYTILFNILSQDDEYMLTFLGRQAESKIGNLYRIERYDRFFELTPFRDLAALCRQWPSFKRKNRLTLDAFVRSVDKLLVMSPMPICIELIKLGVKYNKPIVLLARQDTRRMLPQRYGGVKKIAAMILAHRFERTVENWVRRTDIRVLAFGNCIAQRFQKFTDNICYISTSPYRLSDVLTREDIRPIDWSGKIRLLFVGRIEVNKGLRELLTCLSCRLSFDFSLTIVGDGPFMPEVKQLLARYGIAHKVCLTGYVPFGEKLMQIYKSHDIFILPSYSEGLPQVILEAMAGGCLTMATRVGGIPDVVKPEQTGVLFAPKSVEELKQSLEYAYQHRQEVEQMRINALAIAQEYAFDKQIEILKEQFN